MQISHHVMMILGSTTPPTAWPLRNVTVGAHKWFTLLTNVATLTCNMHNYTQQMHETLDYKQRMTYSSQIPVGITQDKGR